MIYLTEPPRDRLEQGDLLAKTPAVAGLLELYHPYYASHPDNKFFVVLTQSCDLVRRGAQCGARYISIAPVRPLKAVLKREFEGQLENVGTGRRAFATHRVRSSFELFLQRLFNNNEPPFFYFEADHGRGIYEEMCAMLALPIALKPEHYDKFIEAKVAGISDVFQAKLGWLIGQLYSRVGTPDVAEAEITAKVRLYLEGLAVWLEDAEAKALRAEVERRDGDADAKPLNAENLMKFLASMPKRKSQVIDAVLNAAASVELVEVRGPNRLKLRRALENDPNIARLLNG